MKKKVLAALMCAAMTVGMLAGCGGNSTAGNSTVSYTHLKGKADGSVINQVVQKLCQ